MVNRLILFTKNYIYYRTSLQYGISCLKRLNYDRNALEERRKNCENTLLDVLVWSNERLIRWVAAIGLKVINYLCVRFRVNII